MRFTAIFIAFLTLFSVAFGQKGRPTFGEFVGLCGHTVQFKPDLYQPVCRVVRDYHPVKWDLADDTSVLPEWPFAKNRVSWEKVYRSWHEKGLKISVCLIFDDMKAEDWKNIDRDAKAYAKGFAQHFGPAGKWPFVETVEIGNEPGHLDDATFLKIYQAMADGIREGDPKLKIASCNIEAGPSDRYWKGADILKPYLRQTDVLRIHRYAIAEGWPAWRRTWPEDPKVPYLSHIQAMLDWRDANAFGKPLWVSEFGWDCSTQTPDPNGPMAKFVTSSDEEQAKWLVRSFFLFAEMGVDKAFAYFFNDDDKPTFHGCSGLTRNFQPKPSYHAIAWMLKHLETYRFAKAHLKSVEDGYAYEFLPTDPAKLKIIAAWHPTKEKIAWTMPQGYSVSRIEEMPISQQALVPNLSGEKDALSLGTRPKLLWVK